MPLVKAMCISKLHIAGKMKAGRLLKFRWGVCVKMAGLSNFRFKDS